MQDPNTNKDPSLIDNGVVYTIVPLEEDLPQIIQLHDECLPVKLEFESTLC
jgi:hypothetical protein